MPDFVAPSSLRAKLRDGLRATAAFSPSASKVRARTRPPLAPRQQKLRAIWINAMLWTFQGWIAMFYTGAAFAKLTVPYEQLVLLLGWPVYMPAMSVRLIGLGEAALVVAILAPLISKPWTRQFARFSAIALLAIEAAYFLIHLAHLELGFASINLLLVAITAPITLARNADLK